ncbi:MAG: hypothetical protein ABSG89_12420 [Bacteroidales bacterium]|jgi:hypothetical protein
MRSFVTIVSGIFLLGLNLAGQSFGSLKVNSIALSVTKDNRNPSDLSIKEIRDLYYAAASAPDEIINGRKYTRYYFGGKTTPLLFSGLAFRASLDFNGRQCENVRLQYDTYLDQVVYTDTSRLIDLQYPMISLNHDLVRGFSFSYNNESYNFRYVKFTGNSKDILPDGFYEIAYDGPTELLIRHRSVQYVKEAVTEYDYSPESYIFLGGSFSRITNKEKDFIRMFGQQSEAVKEYLRKNRIRYRKAGKDEVAGVLKYYDSINQLKKPE